MIALLTEFLAIARQVWAGIQEDKAKDEIKRDARDRADVAIDLAIARRRLAARKGAK